MVYTCELLLHILHIAWFVCVYVSVCVGHDHEYAKMAEPIEMPCGDVNSNEPRELYIRSGCTWAPPGEYNCIIKNGNDADSSAVAIITFATCLLLLFN